uniref:Uncharacterized protein n=1 Tax=Pseudonaja textilis TaxID=8673 RepID=A0A670ZKW6_PSETE
MVLAALQAVERKADTSAAHLLNLESQMATAEIFECKKAKLKLSSHLAALGTLIQEYRAFQRRLENVENLLKNCNFWILSLPLSPKGEIPKVKQKHTTGAIFACTYPMVRGLQPWNFKMSARKPPSSESTKYSTVCLGPWRSSHLTLSSQDGLRG